MPNALRDTAAVLGRLKDFQRDTVEYVFRRLYTDSDCVRRFLVADEVGLGKTLVARGVIAKTIEFLWEKSQRIDVVYVCSNADIARQNIARLGLGQNHFTLSSRITLLPEKMPELEMQRVNFVSFTPGTSFDVSGHSGRADERVLLYRLLKEAWGGMSFTWGTRVLHAYASLDRFRDRVRRFEQRPIHTGIRDKFAEHITHRPELKAKFDELVQRMPRAGCTVPKEVRRDADKFIGELRRLVAETCLHWLEPDLIILDEFQRFKQLLQGNGDDASDAAQLAHHLFNYQQNQDDPTTAARVLLLSATPYKMYTQSHESDQDDHYADFVRTLEFLVPEQYQRDQLRDSLQQYRDELLRFADHGIDGLLSVKSQLETTLRRVMVRTERLAVTADRNGMLCDMPNDSMRLSAAELRQYLQLQGLARHLGHDDILEYWKSAPYLINFMEDYELKRSLRQSIEDDAQDIEVIRAIRDLEGGLLRRDELERYARLDPANARMRALLEDTVARQAWRLLWIPPALPYYRGDGAYADPALANFTKRLVFSSWRVVPKAIAAIVSYEAERQMIQCFRKRTKNSAEARKKRRPLLRFGKSKGRLTGMPVLAMIFPCRALSERFDPLISHRHLAGSAPTSKELIENYRKQIKEQLEPLVAPYRNRPGQADESWYWAAQLLMDQEHDGDRLRDWLSRAELASEWSGGSGDHEAARNWGQHVRQLQRLLDEQVELGPPPDDLEEVLAKMALAGPGVVAFRALRRISSDISCDFDLRQHAGPLAYAFVHLFNLPEVTAMLRDRNRQVVYWRSALDYCIAGNLQATLDEYAHILVESLGLQGTDAPNTAKAVTVAVRECLTLRTATAQADIVSASRRRVKLEEPVRLRTRFAMRFGDQVAEDGSEPTRADHVRSAFNSPFWPFVLATTSIGQEGLDFHPYCHAVVHWNLPSNPVDLEQREGRVHRYKGHALRKNISAAYGSAARNGCTDPWDAMFRAALEEREQGQCDLFPFWISPNGHAKIERHMPALPHSRELLQRDYLRRSLVLYRMVFGQNRQEDLMHYLLHRLGPREVERIIGLCRVDLGPPQLRGAADLSLPQVPAGSSPDSPACTEASDLPPSTAKLLHQ